MSQDLTTFYSAMLTVASILAGFYGTFLSFRLQREAQFFRNRRQQHTTPSLLVLVMGIVMLGWFGIWQPLSFFAGRVVSQESTIRGVVTALLLGVAYFVLELLHYEILFRWGGKLYNWLVGLALVFISFIIGFGLL